MLDLQSMRVDYKRARLDEQSVDKNPFLQFEKWFSDAQSAKSLELNTLILATSNASDSYHR